MARGKLSTTCTSCSVQFDTRKLYNKHVQSNNCGISNKIQNKPEEETKDVKKAVSNVKKSEKKLDTTDDDIIMLEDEEEESVIAEMGNAVLSETSDIDISDTKEAVMENSELLGENGDEVVSNNVDEDEVEVLKSNIYKYQGELTYEQQINQDILNFKHDDDFDDDDIIILEDDPEVDECKVEEDVVEQEKPVVACSECRKLFEPKDLENHIQSVHPPKKKNFMNFDGGNFFMIAD